MDPMTALVINRKQLGFLRRIVKIHFPSGGPHLWTAHAFVDVTFSYNANDPNFELLLVAPGGVATITPAGLNDPHNVVSNFIIISGSGAVQQGQGDLVIDQDIFSVNPAASVSGIFTVTTVSSNTGTLRATVSGTATGVTSGRPGGDAEQTASSSQISIDSIGSDKHTATVTGSASANLHTVTAAVTAS
jgi:hypothetical protein